MATDFGKRLVAAREHAGLKQEELRLRAGIAQSTMSAAENSGHGSRVTVQLAVACGVNPIWLATGEGEMLDPLVVRAVERRSPAAPSPAAALQTLAGALGQLTGLHLDLARTTLHKLVDHPECLGDAIKALDFALSAEATPQKRQSNGR